MNLLHLKTKSVFALVIVFLCLVAIGAAVDRSRETNYTRGYIDGAYSVVKYRQATGHEPSWAWMVTAAEYSRPNGQSDAEWIRITEAKAAAWQAEHVKN